MGDILIHIVLSICISFLTQILLHEIGHMIFGFVTGWKFLFLQVHRFVIMNANNKMKLIVVRDKGYKCIMYPKSINTDALLYTMGGCIINLISAIIGLLIITTVSIIPVLWIYVWSFSAFGVGLFLMNGIANIKRICNDKACYYILKSNYNAKIYHNAQLLTAKYLMKGLTYRQIGEEIICLYSEMANNDIEAYQVILEYYYYLDTGNYYKARQALDKIESTNNISKELSDIVNLELIYIKMILFFHDTTENNISICDVKKYYKKGDVHSFRVLAVVEAYLQFKEGYKINTLDILSKAAEKIKNSKYVYEGEKKFNIEQLENIKNIINVVE